MAASNIDLASFKVTLVLILNQPVTDMHQLIHFKVDTLTESNHTKKHKDLNRLVVQYVHKLST